LTVQSTRVATTVSTLASSKGRVSAGASTTFVSSGDALARFLSLAAMCGSGSVSSTSERVFG
jgi:hypothetical protein